MRKPQSILSENEKDSFMIEEFDEDTVQVCVGDAETGEEQCAALDKSAFKNATKLALGDKK